jgi:hypothetical protein
VKRGFCFETSRTVINPIIVLPLNSLCLRFLFVIISVILSNHFCLSFCNLNII